MSWRAKNGQKKPWDTDDKESRPPAEKFIDPAAGKQTEHDPERNAKGINAERGGALGRRKVIGDHGMGRRAAAGFAHAHRDPRRKQMPEIHRKTGQGRGAAPYGERPGDQIAAIAAIGEPGNRDPQRCIEQSEGKSGQHAHRGVGEPEVPLDWFQQDREDLAIDEIERVHDDQNRQGVIPANSQAIRNRCFTHSASPQRYVGPG